MKISLRSCICTTIKKKHLFFPTLAALVTASLLNYNRSWKEPKDAELIYPSCTDDSCNHENESHPGSKEPLAPQRNERGLGWDGRWQVREWKTGSGAWEVLQQLPNDPLDSHHRPFPTLRHPIHRASTNKHGMHYIKESQISKAPPQVILERDVAS